MVTAVFLTTIIVGQHLAAAWSISLTMGVIWPFAWICAFIPSYFNHRIYHYEQTILASSEEQSIPQSTIISNQNKPAYLSAQIATSIVTTILLWYILVTLLPANSGGQVDKYEVIIFCRTLMQAALTILCLSFMLSLLILPVTFLMNLWKSRKVLRAITWAVNLGFGIISLGSVIIWYAMCARVVGTAYFTYLRDFWKVYRSPESMGAVIILTLIAVLVWDFCFEGRILQLKNLKSNIN